MQEKQHHRVTPASAPRLPQHGAKQSSREVNIA